MNFNTGLYALCSPQTQAGVDDRAVQFKCCVNRCNKPVEYCFNKCKELYSDSDSMLYRCNLACQEHNTICLDSCKANIWEGKTNSFISCATDIDCWDKVDSVDCIKENKNLLLECCNKTCGDKNCLEMCNYTFDFVTSPLNQVDIYSPEIKNIFEISWVSVYVGVLVAVLYLILYPA